MGDRTNHRGWGWRFGTISVAAVMGVGLVGCGETNETAVSDEAVDEWLNRTGTEDQAKSPMAEFLGMGDTDKMTETFREQSKRQQQSMVECMREQGFEYIAFDPSGSFDMGDFDPFGGLTRKEYVEKWGYGISTTIGPDGQTVDDAPGFNGGVMDEMPEDPNQKIVESLSDEERQAYEKALYGEMNAMTETTTVEGGGGSEVEGGEISIDESGEISSDADTGAIEAGDMPDFSEMGCSGAAMADSMEGFGEDDMAEMTKAEEEMIERVDADPAVKQATRDFGACMKEAGFAEVKAEGDAQSLVSDRMQSEVYQFNEEDPSASGGDGSEVGGDEFAVDETISETTGSEVDAAALKKLQQFELEIAKAELPCLAAYQVTIEKVRFAEERRFIEENPELVARMKTAFGG